MSLLKHEFLAQTSEEITQTNSPKVTAISNLQHKQV